MCSYVWIPFGDQPSQLERYREDYHGPCTRMTRTNREVYQIFFPRRSVFVFFSNPRCFDLHVRVTLPPAVSPYLCRTTKDFPCAKRARCALCSQKRSLHTILVKCTIFFCAQMCLCLFHHTISILLRSARACFPAQKGVVVHFALTRGHCTSFWFIVPPLQVAPSLACSVASLSHSPGH